MTMIREDDMDLIQKHQELMDALHHVAEENEAGLAEQIMTARKYIRSVCRRRKNAEHRTEAIVQRILFCAAVLFVMALLVG